MTTYIDDLKMPYRRMLMSHMMADTVEELHKMADKIGINRKWFQTKKGKYPDPHYDICQTKKALAIEHGAVEVDFREFVKIMRRLRKQ